MTTPRINEMVEEFQSKYSFDWSSDVVDNFRQALTQAHQAGRDEAVEKIKKLRKTETYPQSLTRWNGTTEYFGRLSDADIHYNKALEDIIRALQDNK